MLDFLICLTYFLSSFSYGSIFLIKLFEDKFIKFSEFVVFSTLIGVLINSLFSFYLSHFIDIKIATAIVLLVSAIPYVFLIKKLDFKFKLDKGLLIFNLFWLLCFGIIINQTHLKPDEYNLNGSPSTSGDFPFHLGLISNFAYGNNFPSVNPIAPFKKLNYHFVADFVSAQFLVLGSSLRGALILPSVVLGLILVNSIYFLTLKVFKNKMTAFISVFLFLFNGGLGFVKPFYDKLPLSSYIDATIRFSYLPQLGAEYPGIFAEILMAERALFVGIPLWILAIYLLILLLNNKNNSKIFFASAFVAGLLPFANIYAFVVFMMSLFVFALLGIVKNRNKFELKFWFKYCFLIFIISSLFTIPTLLATLNSEKFIRFAILEWPPVQGFYRKILFYFSNFGLTFILGLCMIFAVAFRKRFGNKAVLLVNALIIFVANIILFQPYAWDNNRFVLYPFIIFSILASYPIAKLIEHKRFDLKFIGLLIFLLSIISGILVSINDPRMLGGLFSKSDLVMAEEIRNITKPNEIFLTSRNFNNVITTLVGRKIFLGFSGYLWTHGVNDTLDREGAMISIFETRGDFKSLVKKYNIDYIYVGPWELSEFQVNSKVLKSTYPVLYSKNGVTIYKTTSLSN